MLILTDLDDTLFQTARKCPANGGELQTMSYLANGEQSGFATERQQRLLSWMAGGRIVPVTARDRDVLARVEIGQTPAICANGGCIIRADGEVDAHWHEILKARAGEGIPVRIVYEDVTASLATESYRHWVVCEDGLALYIVIKSNSDDGSVLGELERELAPRLPGDWRIHRNGNNLAFLPPWLNKRDAARYLIDQFRENDQNLPVVGIGDSHSDVGFMDLCDYAMTPTTSQVWQQLVRENRWC